MMVCEFSAVQKRGYKSDAGAESYLELLPDPEQDVFATVAAKSESQPLTTHVNGEGSPTSPMMGTYVYTDQDRDGLEHGTSSYLNPLASPYADPPSNGFVIPLQERAAANMKQRMPELQERVTDMSYPSPERDRKVSNLSYPPNPEAHSKKFKTTKERQLSDETDGKGMERNAYLTPTDPPNYIDSDFSIAANAKIPMSSSPPHATPSFKPSDNVNMRGTRLQRFDSGVDDCDSERGSTTMSSQSSVSCPRLSTHYEQDYEDIDQYSNEHHRKQRKSTDKMQQLPPQPPRSSIDKTGQTNQHPLNGLRPLPVVDISGVVNSESDDNLDVRTTSIAEMVSAPHRGNPSSMSANSTATYNPHLYMPLGMERKPNQTFFTSTSRKSCCALVFVLCLIFAMSAAALSLSIYSFLTNDDTEPQSAASTAATQGSEAQALFKQLKQEIDQLKAENVELKQALASYQANITSQFEPVQNELTVLHTQQRDSVKNYSTEIGRLQTQIANISLTPGPQGPAGVANFSLCSFTSTTTTGVSSNTVSTDYHPSEQELQTSFVVFAFCSAQSSSYTELDTREVEDNLLQYKCSCVGNSSGDFTRCKLNMWLCPRLQSSPDNRQFVP